MRNEKLGKEQKMAQVKVKLRKAMNCLCSGELAKADEMIPSSESLATKDCSTSVYSSQAREAEMKPDAGNIEEVESSLRESGSLNYEGLSKAFFSEHLLLKFCSFLLVNAFLICVFSKLYDFLADPLLALICPYFSGS